MKQAVALFLGYLEIVFLSKFMNNHFLSINFSKNILCIIIYALISFSIYLYIKDIKDNKRLNTISLVLGLIWSFSIVTGTFLKYEKTINSLLYILNLITLTIAFAGMNKELIKRLIDYKSRIQETKIDYKKNLKIRFIIYCLIIFLCYIPIFLAYYPTIFAYDVHLQLNQAIMNMHSMHHPLLHTIFVFICYKFGLAIGSTGIGMALYSIIQMIIMASIFSFSLIYMHKKGISTKIIYGSLAFFALFPVNSILSISTTKDVVFSGLFLIIFILLSEMINRENINIKFKIIYVITVIIMLLFRNNAIYAFLFVAPLTILFNKNKKAWLILNILVIVFFYGINNYMKTKVNAIDGPVGEKLCVPIQQVARVYSEKENELEKEVKEKIDKYFLIKVSDRYLNTCADSVKSNINNVFMKSNLKEFINLWIRLGIKYPLTYFEAFLDNTRGYWYINDNTHSNIYGEGIDGRQGYLLTDHKIIYAKEQIPEYSYLPNVKAIYEVLFSANEYRKIPIISVLFNLTTYTFIMVYYVALNVYEKKYKNIILMIFPIGYFATLLLGPVALIRYMYPFVVISPLLISNIIQKQTVYDK